VLWVNENRLSEKFYRKLGFEIIESSETYTIAKLNDFTITLVNVRDEERFAHDAFTGKKGKGMYLYIHVDDIDAQYKLLKSVGLETTEPKDWEWGNREIMVKDPDGYKLVFWEKIHDKS
jgi:uncharacterized glyoxalase superfamily protein PhnB